VKPSASTTVTGILAMPHARPSSSKASRSLLLAGTLSIAFSHAVWTAQASKQARTRAANTPLVLDGATSILIGADESPAVVEAARDLASDFEKVLGRKPRLVQRRE